MHEFLQRIFDLVFELWAYLGDRLGRRPFQMLGIITGLVILVASLSYSLATSVDNSKDIAAIQKEICSSRADFTVVEEDCRRLFDQLLKSTTPEQAESLRRILKGLP